jgi:hypothetical protein
VRTFIAISLLIIAIPAVALAGGKPLPASQHNPPVFLDEPTFYIELIHRSDAGYAIKSHVEIGGATSETDMLRIDWMQKGKVVVSVKCRISVEKDSPGKWAGGDCDYEPTEQKPLKAKGDIEARVIYWDDQEEKEYLVRTAKLKVGTWP